MTNGILYVATGDDYIREATVSAEYIDSVVDLPIGIVADRDVDAEVFDEVVIDKKPTYSFIDKARNLHQSPFDKTLFIDSDVYILSNVDEVFELLDNFEMAACVDPVGGASRLRGIQYFEDVPQSIPEYNTGVLAYQNTDRMADFFDTWVENFSDTHHNAQFSFRKTLADSNINFTALSPLYNCLINYPTEVTGEVKILHDVSRTFLTEDKRLVADIDAHAERINRNTGMRVLHTSRESTVYPRSEQGNQITHALWMLNNVFLLYSERGFRETATIVLNKIKRTVSSKSHV